MAWVCWVYRVSGTRVLYFKLYSIVLLCVCACMHAQLLSYVQLFVTPMDCRPPGFSVHGILQAGILEWIVILFSRKSSWPRGQTWVSCIAGRLFTVWATKFFSPIPQEPVCLIGDNIAPTENAQSKTRPEWSSTIVPCPIVPCMAHDPWMSMRHIHSHIQIFITLKI